MRFSWPGIFAAFLTWPGCFLNGATALDGKFAAEVQSAAALVSSQPQLLEWRVSRTRERTDLAHPETSKDPYETDFGLEAQWCATSVNSFSGLTRAASFYVPRVTQGVLPPLPNKPDSALVGSCRLGAVWYQTAGTDSFAGTVKALETAWGKPAVIGPAERSRNLFIRGSGLWKDVAAWRRGNVTAWVAWTDWDKGGGTGARTIAWIAREGPRTFADLPGGLDMKAAAIRIASLDPALAAGIEPKENCSTLDPALAVQRLSRWLEAARNLPAQRRAAALLAADSYASCVQASGASQKRLAGMGLKFIPSCPQDGPVYANNFREQAMALDPQGPVGALATLATLQSPCSLKGRGTWPELVLAAQKPLAQLPEGEWSPWIHLALAWAHDAKLLFSLPPGEIDTGIIINLTPAQALRERQAAIEEFQLFIAGAPRSKEAVAAWQEAWRLLAGLPPRPIHFGCNCE